MEGKLIQNTLSTISKDMYNYLSCKDIDRFYMTVNITSGKAAETTSNVSARGIILKMHYNYPGAENGIVRIDYTNNNNGYEISGYDCLMSDLKKYVGKAYKASSDRFFA